MGGREGGWEAKAVSEFFLPSIHFFFGAWLDESAGCLLVLFRSGLGESEMHACPPALGWSLGRCEAPGTIIVKGVDDAMALLYDHACEVRPR